LSNHIAKEEHELHYRKKEKACKIHSRRAG